MSNYFLLAVSVFLVIGTLINLIEVIKEVRSRRQDEKELTRHRCNDLLRAMMGKDLVAQWWTGPNRAFDMQTPETVFDKDHERVHNYLMKFAHGEW